MEEITSTVAGKETEPATHRNFDITSYARAQEKMIATNDNAYNDNGWGNYYRHLSYTREYTPSDIDSIIEQGTLDAQQKLSRHFFCRDGYYKQIIIHYATLLKYVGLLIPNPSFGKKLSSSHIGKRYYNAMEFVENMSLPAFLTNCALRALVDGSYFGLRVDTSKNTFSVIDLPSGYARSRFKDVEGNDLVEFDLRYFDSITDKATRKIALSTYPKVISKAYDRYHSGRIQNWFLVPKDIGICFPFFDGRPLFLSVIPKTLEYDTAIGIEQARNTEEIRKILVQEIPHLTDGRLLFEPEEAVEMHQGTVEMMKSNPNTSVLTTYGKVQAITTNVGAEQHTFLTQSEHNIFAQAGVSDQIFSSNGSSTLESSIKNDVSIMMYLAHKFESFITNTINAKFANGNIAFKYVILPISIHNEGKYITENYKLANSGYSFLLPALAQGFTQRDFTNLKDLENDLLKLGEKMKPLSSAHTQSAAEGSEEPTDNAPEGDPADGGRPTKDQEEKAEGTQAKEESLDKTAGGS